MFSSGLPVCSYDAPLVFHMASYVFPTRSCVFHRQYSFARGGRLQRLHVQVPPGSWCDDAIWPLAEGALRWEHTFPAAGGQHVLEVNGRVVARAPWWIDRSGGTTRRNHDFSRFVLLLFWRIYVFCFVLGFWCCFAFVGATRNCLDRPQWRHNSPQS